MKKILSLLLTICLWQIMYGQNGVGIGTLNPHAPLQFANEAAARKIVLFEVSNNDHRFFGFGVGPEGALKYQTATGGFDHVFQSALSDSTSLELMRITGVGNVGIGTYPTAQLHLSNSVQNRKIVLYDETGNNNEFFGFGISAGTLRYQVNDPFNDHVFFAGSSDSTSNELMRIRGSGQIGMGVTTPQNKLDINNGVPRTGTHGTGQALYVTSNFSNAEGVQFRQSDGTEGIGFTQKTIYAAGSNVNQDLWMTSKGPGGALLFGTNNYARMYIAGNGMVGIGTTQPHAALQFLSVVANRKIVLYESADNDHQFFGFGVNSNGTLRYQTAQPAYDHVFYTAANETTSNELFRIKGTGQIGIGTSSPHASSILEVESTTKGILIPRMTTGDRNAIDSPANGLLVFDITTNSFWFRGLSAWVELSDNLDTEVFRNGPDKIYMGLTDSVGIGTLNPAFKLDVRTSNSQYGLAHTDGTIKLATWLGDGGEIGTVTNHAFRLYANNGLKQFELLPNGKIGIGLTNPLNRFDINHGAADRTGTHATGQALYVTGDFGSASNGVQFRSNDATQGIGFGYNTIYAAGANTNQDLNLTAKGATGNLSMSTNGIERLKITGGGNLGLGVTTPANKLDVQNETARTGTHNTGQALYVTGGGEFRSADATLGLGIGSNNIFATGSNANVDLLLSGKGATGNLSMSTNGIERLKITGGGNLGLGVTTPVNKLDINNGVPRTGTHDSGLALYVTGISEFRSADATQGVGIFYNNIYATGSNANVDLSLVGKGPTGNINFHTNGAEKVRITSSGNVGIGISNANAPLQFATTAANRKIVLYEAANNDHQYIGFGVDGSGALRYQTAAAVNDHIFYTAASSSSSNELMRITGTGLVGIGQSTPHAALQFSNNVTAKKVVLFEYANNNSEFSGFGIGGDGSMRYEVPTEGAEHIFYSGAGPGGFVELMRIGSINGITIEKATSINGSLTVEGAIVTEPFTEPTLLNGFTNYNVGYATAAFYKDKMGIVHLRGLVSHNTNQNGLIIFTLPEGYRPATSGSLLFTATAASGVTRIDVLANGNVVVMGPSTGYLSLDGITFRAD